MPVDLAAAVLYLEHRLEPHPTGDCARHVREALDVAGFDTSGHPGAAKLYGPFLERLGFVAQPADECASRLVGDVRVWQGTPSDPAGHVALWSGTAWLADFEMRSDLPGRSFEGTPFATYRYPATA